MKNEPDLTNAIKPLPVIKANYAIRLIANIDFEDAQGQHMAGEKWQLEGPLTYKPQPEAVCIMYKKTSSISSYYRNSVFTV